VADPVFGSGNRPVGLPSARRGRPARAPLLPAPPSFMGASAMWSPRPSPPRSSAGETGWGRAGRAGGAAAGSVKGGVAA